MELHVNDIKLSESNPRSISEKKYQQLIKSVLVFPRMLSIRHIVVKDGNEVLGGNMRARALQTIATLSYEEIERRLKAARDFQKYDDTQKQATLDYWKRWLKNPVVDVKDAAFLSDRERQQFIIKDNAEFGDWDWDRLANNWDNLDLNEWGLDVWGTEDMGEEEETPEKAEKAAKDVKTTITITLADNADYDTVLAAVELAVSDYGCKVK